MDTAPDPTEKFFNSVHGLAVLLTGAAILGGLYGATRWLDRKTANERSFQMSLVHMLDQASASHEHVASLETLKTMDLEQLKAGISGHAQSEKSLFESGLSLQEERRLLEKQLEIMTTTLLINPALQRVFLMRAEQVLQSYLISYIPLRAFGSASVTLPSTVRIVSKERFAHPERGKSEEVNGTLQWVPPQVGSSVRSNALGEFVIFTNSGLILHGPPLNEEDHERFPHICLGLDREAARKLYRATYIGTRINLSQITIEPTTAVSTSSGPATGAVQPLGQTPQ
jgi:hypothetical protein